MREYCLNFLIFLCCGFPYDANGSRRIQGGRTVGPYDEGRPAFMARVVIKPDDLAKLVITRRICGGTIVHPYFILSAAQCYQSYQRADSDAKLSIRPEDVTVYLGSVFIDEGIPHEVRKIHNHPKYNDQEKFFDIALLRTTQIQFTQGTKLNIQKRPVWLATEKFPPEAEFTPMKIYGWGITKVGDNNTLSTRLQELDVWNIDEKFCKLLAKENLGESEMCADNFYNTTFCFGDPGGPLMVGYEQIGIISRPYTNDIECSYHPNIYTQVHADLAWMKSVTKVDLLSWISDECKIVDTNGHRIINCPNKKMRYDDR